MTALNFAVKIEFFHRLLLEYLCLFLVSLRRIQAGVFSANEQVYPNRTFSSGLRKLKTKTLSNYFVVLLLYSLPSFFVISFQQVFSVQGLLS
ncbi:hypothetical protein [Flavobacterium sp.]|uniref:hypothetical protein n=1 Tax=Flavobacterium sp. TaxID=239 RepID=UPI0039E2ED58